MQPVKMRQLPLPKLHWNRRNHLHSTQALENIYSKWLNGENIYIKVTQWRSLQFRQIWVMMVSDSSKYASSGFGIIAVSDWVCPIIEHRASSTIMSTSRGAAHWWPIPLHTSQSTGSSYWPQDYLVENKAFYWIWCIQLNLWSSQFAKYSLIVPCVCL